jgi:hypothetical protein
VTSRGPSNPSASSQWYRSAPWNCIAASPQNCDEWPWKFVDPSGPGNAHLRILNGAHNQASGSDAGTSFTARCNVQTGEQFMVVPLPREQVLAGHRSVFLCDDE